MAIPLDESARMYCEEADVTTRIDISNLPSCNLEYLIKVATARIERITGREFQRVPASGTETRHFLGSGSGQLFIDDLLTLSSLTIDDDDEDVDDILCMPFGKSPTTWLEWESDSGGTWPLREDVAVTGVWGYSDDVPWDIWDACVGLVVRALGKAKSAYQDASAIPELGQLVYSMNLPPDVKDTLMRLKRGYV